MHGNPVEASAVAVIARAEQSSWTRDRDHACCRHCPKVRGRKRYRGNVTDSVINCGQKQIPFPKSNYCIVVENGYAYLLLE